MTPFRLLILQFESRRRLVVADTGAPEHSTIYKITFSERDRVKPGKSKSEEKNHKMTEKINVTTENICTERKKFQVPNQTFRVLTLNGVTTVAAYDNGNFIFYTLSHNFPVFQI